MIANLNDLGQHERNKLKLKIRIEREKRRRAEQSSQQYTQYQSNPVAFCQDVLGAENITADIKAMMESVKDYPVTVAKSANGVGKTWGAAHLAVWFYKVFPGAQVYTTAAPPIDNLKKLLWGEIGKIKRANSSVFKSDRDRELMISRPLSSVDPNEFITGVTIPSTGGPEERESKFSGKHAPNIFFIIDEGDAVPSEVYKGIDSCMSGGFARLLILYNPRSEDGEASRLEAEGANVITMSALDFPNVVTGQDIIPGAVTQEKTVNRIYSWTRPYDEAISLGFVGFGTYDVPQHLVGVVCQNEKTKEPLPPLRAGKRMVIVPEFCYMVLARYPGVSAGIIYDTWRDGWRSVDPDLVALSEQGTWAQCQGVEWPHVEGNVSAEYDYVPGEGSVYWSLDEGYEGKVDQNGNFTADSHPRALHFIQYKPNGDAVVFDEIYMVLEPSFEVYIGRATDKGYERPEFVVLGPGSKALGGWLSNNGYYKRTCQAIVEDSIKELRKWISPDEQGHIRLKVHPRCKHLRYEMSKYRRDANGRIKKEFDHGPDGVRYFVWQFRNME